MNAESVRLLLFSVELFIFRLVVRSPFLNSHQIVSQLLALVVEVSL